MAPTRIEFPWALNSACGAVVRGSQEGRVRIKVSVVSGIKLAMN